MFSFILSPIVQVVGLCMLAVYLDQNDSRSFSLMFYNDSASENFVFSIIMKEHLFIYFEITMIIIRHKNNFVTWTKHDVNLSCFSWL